MTAVATAVELLEESGLPPLCVAIAMEEDASKTLGAVLAQAVQVSYVAASNVECSLVFTMLVFLNIQYSAVPQKLIGKYTAMSIVLKSSSWQSFDNSQL